MSSIPVYMIVDPPADFITSWGGKMTLEMRKGWETWINPRRYKQYVGRGGTIHPEGNRYGINFPGEWFAFDKPIDVLDKFFAL